jgi:hypothetical protein
MRLRVGYSGAGLIDTEVHHTCCFLLMLKYGQLIKNLLKSVEVMYTKYFRKYIFSTKFST